MSGLSRDVEFQKVHTVEELRQFVNHDESHGRTKFALRVFYVLQFVKDHPESMLVAGASWCQDKIHFAANSKLLAEFLKLKSNSINTNFRANGFKIVGNNNLILKKEFPEIKETGHWKIRYSNCASFRSDSTGKDVEHIKSIDQSSLPLLEGSEVTEISTTLSDNIPFIPKETLELLIADQQQIYYLIQMYYAVTEDEDLFRNFLKYVTDLWRNKIESNREYAPIQTILSVILDINPNYENENDSQNDIWISLYEKNLQYLIPQNNENSQICDTISFISFSKYFMRFCDCFDFSSTLKEITCMPKYYNFEPSFKNWFNASSDKNQAITFLMKQKNRSWLLIPSKGPNKFTLMILNDKKIAAIHIKHNPIPSHPSKRYSVTCSDTEKFGQSLDDIFSNVLNLKYPDFETENSYKLPEVSYVQADEIFNISNSNEQNNNNNNNDGGGGGGFVNDSQNDESQNSIFGESQSESQQLNVSWSFNSQLGFSQSNFDGESQNLPLGYSQNNFEGESQNLPSGFSQNNLEGESQNSQFFYFPNQSQKDI